LHYFYFEQSLITPELASIYWDSNFSFKSINSVLSKFIDLQYDDIARVVIGIYIFSSVLLCFGIIPRFAALLALAAHFSLLKSTPYFLYGVDYFTSSSLFYCCLFPIGNKFSVGNIFQPEIRVTPIIFKKVIQLHLSLIYFFSGLGKSLGINWWNGESIWKAINLPYSNIDYQIDFYFLLKFPFLITAIGISVIVLETLYPVFIFIEKTKKTWLTLVVLMHFSIGVILNLYVFSAILIIWNLTAFYFEDQNENSRYTVGVEKSALSTANSNLIQGSKSSL
jgi:hypothetical protein